MKKITKNDIKSVINEWDPIELLPFSPHDEYDDEIEKIYSAVKNNSQLTDVEVAEIIYNIFYKSFGKKLFSQSLVDCEAIAKKIVVGN